MKIQRTKTKILRKSNCQYVTGVVLNKKISAGSKEKRNIRQQVYYIGKYGFDSHTRHIGLEKQNYLNHLLGKINWVLYLEKNNEEFIGYKKYVSDLIKDFN